MRWVWWRVTFLRSHLAEAELAQLLDQRLVLRLERKLVGLDGVELLREPRETRRRLARRAAQRRRLLLRRLQRRRQRDAGGAFLLQVGLRRLGLGGVRRRDLGELRAHPLARLGLELEELALGAERGERALGRLVVVVGRLAAGRREEVEEGKVGRVHRESRLARGPRGAGRLEDRERGEADAAAAGGAAVAALERLARA